MRDIVVESQLVINSVFGEDGEGSVVVANIFGNFFETVDFHETVDGSAMSYDNYCLSSVFLGQHLSKTVDAGCKFGQGLTVFRFPMNISGGTSFEQLFPKLLFNGVWFSFPLPTFKDSHVVLTHGGRE